MAETKAKTTIVKKEEKVNKFGKQEKFTAGGIEYVFQFPGTRKVQEIVDDAKVRGFLRESLYNEQLMEHVIVKPNNVNFEYWDENEGYREVLAAADRFLGGLL